MYATAEFVATDTTPSGLARARDLDVSVSHADRLFTAPSVPAGQSPLMVALVAFADLGDVSLCTPARRIGGNL